MIMMNVATLIIVVDLMGTGGGRIHRAVDRDGEGNTYDDVKSSESCVSAAFLSRAYYWADHLPVLTGRPERRGPHASAY
jgi:hypothetical protein